MRFIKNGIIYNSITKLEYNDRLYINPSLDIILAAGYEIYNPEPTPSELLENARHEKLEALEHYDSSSEVNLFYLNGYPAWLDKATRVGLTNAIEMLRLASKETIDLWFGSIMLTLPLDTAKSMLSALEVYALESYNVTAQHKVNIENLATIEEIEAYDFKTGYPDKLHLGQE